MNTETLEIIKLVATETPTAKIVFNSLARRQRFRYETNLNKMKNLLLNRGEKIVEAEYRTLFRKLQDYGVGSIIYGRGSNPNKFKWNYNLRELAKAATGKELKAEDIREIGVTHRVTRRKPLTIKKPVPMVRSKDVNLTFTVNISSEDIQAVLNFIKGVQP